MKVALRRTAIIAVTLDTFVLLTVGLSAAAVPTGMFGGTGTASVAYCPSPVVCVGSFTDRFNAQTFQTRVVGGQAHTVDSPAVRFPWNHHQVYLTGTTYTAITTTSLLLGLAMAVTGGLWWRREHR